MQTQNQTTTTQHPGILIIQGIYKKYQRNTKDIQQYANLNTSQLRDVIDYVLSSSITPNNREYAYALSILPVLGIVNNQGALEHLQSLTSRTNANAEVDLQKKSKLLNALDINPVLSPRAAQTTNQININIMLKTTDLELAKSTLNSVVGELSGDQFKEILERLFSQPSQPQTNDEVLLNTLFAKRPTNDTSNYIYIILGLMNNKNTKNISSTFLGILTDTMLLDDKPLNQNVIKKILAHPKTGIETKQQIANLLTNTETCPLWLGKLLSKKGFTVNAPKMPTLEINNSYQEELKGIDSSLSLTSSVNELGAQLKRPAKELGDFIKLVKLVQQGTPTNLANNENSITNYCNLLKLIAKHPNLNSADLNNLYTSCLQRSYPSIAMVAEYMQKSKNQSNSFATYVTPVIKAFLQNPNTSAITLQSIQTDLNKNRQSIGETVYQSIDFQIKVYLNTLNQHLSTKIEYLAAYLKRSLQNADLTESHINTMLSNFIMHSSHVESKSIGKTYYETLALIAQHPKTSVEDLLTILLEENLYRNETQSILACTLANEIKKYVAEKRLKPLNNSQSLGKLNKMLQEHETAKQNFESFGLARTDTSKLLSAQKLEALKYTISVLNRK